MLNDLLESRKKKMDPEESKKLGLAPDLKAEAGEEVAEGADPKEGLLESPMDEAQEAPDFKLQDLLNLSDEDKMKIMDMIEMQKQGKPTNSSLSDKIMMTAMKKE